MSQRYLEFHFRNGKMARNRMVVPPMASQTADEHGFATDKTIAHYANLGRSGAGLIFAEYSFVHQTGKGEAHQLGAQDDGKTARLSRIASAIHESGALAGLQLVHVGGKTTTEITGLPLMAPSNLRVPVKGWEPGSPVEMSMREVENWKA